MLMKLSGVSSYVAKSGVRCRELKNIAEYNTIIVCSFLKIFEKQWNEFTHQLVESILKSWNALIMYLNSTTCTETRGFSTYLCNEHNLRLLCFIADVLIIFSRYQKIFNPIRLRYLIFINNLIICRFVIFFIFNIAEIKSPSYSE